MSQFTDETFVDIQKKRIKELLDNKKHIIANNNDNEIAKVNLDNDVEDILVDLMLNFVQETTEAACANAINRQSQNLELRDVKYYIENNAGIHLPGFRDTNMIDQDLKALLKENTKRKSATTNKKHEKDLHSKRLQLLR